MDLSRLDRRIVFLVLALAVLPPVLFTVKFSVPVGADTRKVFQAIDTLAAGQIVMVSFDFEASSQPEMQPLTLAVLEHAFRKHLRVVGLALFSEGAALGYTMLTDVASRWGGNYGEDYLYLGFRPQYIAAILGMGESIGQVFPEDYRKRPLGDYSAFAELRNYDQVALVVSVADGSLPVLWAEYANARYHQEVAVVCAAVMVTSFKPYFKSGQLIGPVGGIPGAAEYEELLGHGGPAHRSLLALSSGNLVIILLVSVANLAALARRRRGD